MLSYPTSYAYSNELVLMRSHPYFTKRRDRIPTAPRDDRTSTLPKRDRILTSPKGDRISTLLKVRSHLRYINRRDRISTLLKVRSRLKPAKAGFACVDANSIRPKLYVKFTQSRTKLY
ncbi:hypothetical protein B7486_24725 [cyanobacterium TDX16]|nr:hypothetical protein B7486_24725 [cyanobacterium TDX16]